MRTEVVRVEIEPLRVTIEPARNFGQLDHRGGVRFRAVGERGIDFLELAQELLRLGETLQNRVVALGKLPRNCRREFDQTLAVTGQPIARVDFLLLVRLKLRSADFVHLVAK